MAGGGCVVNTKLSKVLVNRRQQRRLRHRGLIKLRNLGRLVLRLKARVLLFGRQRIIGTHPFLLLFFHKLIELFLNIVEIVLFQPIQDIYFDAVLHLVHFVLLSFSKEVHHLLGVHSGVDELLHGHLVNEASGILIFVESPILGVALELVALIQLHLIDVMLLVVSL